MTKASKIKDWKLTTDTVIARMLTENTGSHFLDSGGAYGRGWQQRAGMTVDDFRARPPVRTEVYSGCEIADDGSVIKAGDGIVILDTFHYLSSKLDYCAPLTFGFHRFGKGANRKDDPWLVTMGEYSAKRITGDPDADEKDIQRTQQDQHFSLITFNSYNDENLLSSEIQGVAFVDDTYGPVVILHTHNGCDVRGGYSTPYVFTINTDEPHDLFDWCRYSVVCSELGTEAQIQERRAGMLPGLADATPLWSEVHCWDRYNVHDWVEYGGMFVSDPWEKAGKPQWHVPDDAEYGKGHLLCPACSARAEVYP
jgi:hypothetical protein